MAGAGTHHGQAGRILALAWPLLIGQLAVMLNGLIDTVMAGRASAVDVAAVGLGASVYISVYVGAMGVVLALSPIVAQHFGAGRLQRIGIDFAQGLWLALLMAIPGCLLLGMTDFWLSLSAPPPEVAERTRTYLLAVAAGLPAALLFRVFYALNSALSRPKSVMLINLLGVALKFPLNLLFMDGARLDLGPLTLDIPALGGPGCGVATALVSWLSAAIACGWLLLDPWYRQFGLFHRLRPDWPVLRELLRLGIPIGASYLVEVTSFTFMALFVARLGETVGASHQIASNLASLVFMVAFSISAATGVLTGQAIGARDEAQGRRVVATGLRLMMAAALLTAASLWLARGAIAGLYSSDAAVIAAALPLIAMVALFHLFDAAQTFLVNVLRAYKVASLPTVVYLLALWGVGLGGGWWLSFVDHGDSWAGAWQAGRAGAAGFWLAATLGLALASAGLTGLLLIVWRQRDRLPATQPVTDR